MDLIILLVAGIIVFNYVHESGHFIAARLTGVKVGTFFLGFGPRVGERTGRDGAKFRFGVIPGASLQFAPKAFAAAPPLRRVLVAASGPLANFALTFLLFAAAYILYPATPLSPVIEVADRQGPAATSGLQSGDRIVAVDGVQTEDWQDVGRALLDRVGDSGVLSIAVNRNGESVDHAIPVQEWQSDRARIDVFDDLGIQPIAPSPQEEAERGRGPPSSVAAALVDTVQMGLSSAAAGFKVVFGGMSVLNFGGGLQTTQLGVDAGNLALVDYLLILGLFSMCFGIINSLPGPIVDGLDVIKGVVEWIARTPLPAAADKALFIVGTILAFGPIPVCIVHELIRVT